MDNEHLMDNAKQVRLDAKQTMGRRITWAQIQLDALERLQLLTREHSKAAELMMCLIRHMKPGSGGVVVVSRKTMCELLGASMPTVERALRVLITDGWVQRMRIGSAHALAINDRVAWVGPRGDMQHAVFSATVIASRSEQDAIALSPPTAQQVPIIERGEQPLPVGPGLEPPAQPDLECMPSVVIERDA